MEKALNDLVEISRFFGHDKEAVIAGGGNTSYKTQEHIWVKASGTSLGSITKEGFVQLDRQKLKVIAEKTYPENSEEREHAVKTDLYAACISANTLLRPSVETSLHDTLSYPFVVHLHPTLVNGLLCGNNSEEDTKKLFGKEALYVPYTDPGYILFKEVEKAVKDYRKTFGHDPRLLFLENHGLFLSADTTQEIKNLYDQVIQSISKEIKETPEQDKLPTSIKIVGFLPAMRMMLSEEGLKVLRIRNNKLISSFASDEANFAKISKPFSPDIIVYCKASFLYIDSVDSPETIISSFTEKLTAFKQQHGYAPKIILIKKFGLVAAEDNAQSAETALDIFEDLMKISYYTESFGGPRFMSDKQIQFIENWEIENYRRKIAKGSATAGKVAGKTAIVTGGALGFGAGIAEELIKAGANVVIADIDPIEGENTCDNLNKSYGRHKVVFQKTDVSVPSSVEKMIRKTVEMFGGVDIMISNAGILKAGGLDEMSFDVFERMTKVNYSAYFLCAKYASAVMKLQNLHSPDHFMDIIQINSKSGLKGSNRNFAYAGGKFGGIGLTQSFALELMPFNIKVNSVCPGNFFEGPLWSDPRKGLFVQYLKADKVPGAKTIEDVKHFYEQQVPAGRGCRVEDVMKAIFYVIEQHYETGQAIPVTGGQSMLK